MGRGEVLFEVIPPKLDRLQVYVFVQIGGEREERGCPGHAPGMTALSDLTNCFLSSYAASVCSTSFTQYEVP